MSAAAAKFVQKEGDAKLSSVEAEVASCLAELAESPACTIQADVAAMKIAAAMELPVSGDRKVIAVAFPYRVFMNNVRKNQARLISELEKKLRRHVVVYPRRRILTRKNLKSYGLKVLPRTRTLTAVHDALLEDIVGPTEVVGKRMRVRIDGSKIYKVFLDPKEKNNKENIEEKLDSFAEVYKKLTNKTAVFSFDC